MNTLDYLPPMDRRSSNGTPLYRKECACGAVSIVDKRKLGKPCRACAMKALSTHGLSQHPLYKLLKNIEARCLYPSATNYQYYGGRGISVCMEWRDNPKSFVDWALSLGWKRGAEVDRRDADGDYSPDNCRLLTHQENSQRTRRITTSPEQARNVKELLGAGASITDAALKSGVSYMVAWHIKNTRGVWGNV